MRPARALPQPLLRRAFTIGQLTDHGESPERARRSDIAPLGSGVYAPKTLVEESDTASLYRWRALALGREYDSGWLSHITAARLMKCPLAARLRESNAIHISVPLGHHRPRRSGVTGHEVQAADRHIAAMPGISDVRLSAPARMFLEMAQFCSVDELVVVGDWLVRDPYLLG